MNQNDRELLELAAKASGWTVVRWTDDDTALLLEGIQEPFNALHENPHSDCMGDALRLGAALRLHILHNDPDDSVLWVSAVLNKRGFHGVVEFQDEVQRTGATRRAIVLAAAEIAKVGGAV